MGHVGHGLWRNLLTPRWQVWDNSPSYNVSGPARCRSDSDFHGGKKPDLADLSVYGVMRAVEGFESFKDAVANTKIGPWYYRVKEVVGASARTNPVA